MQIVYVKWRDAYLNEGWHNEAGIDQITEGSTPLDMRLPTLQHRETIAIDDFRNSAS